jgi:hypothetical protein
MEREPDTDLYISPLQSFGPLGLKDDEEDEEDDDSGPSGGLLNIFVLL